VYLPKFLDKKWKNHNMKLDFVIYHKTIYNDISNRILKYHYTKV